MNSSINSLIRDLGFGKSKMETHILEEVDKLCDKLDSDGHHGSRAIDLSQRMNISIVNALWVLLVGEKLELDDKRLKV